MNLIKPEIADRQKPRQKPYKRQRNRGTTIITTIRKNENGEHSTAFRRHRRKGAVSYIAVYYFAEVEAKKRPGLFSCTPGGYRMDVLHISPRLSGTDAVFRFPGRGLWWRFCNHFFFTPSQAVCDTPILSQPRKPALSAIIHAQQAVADLFR